MAQENINPLSSTELTVTVKSQTYIFKIPSIRDESRIGSYARYLRAQDDPAGVGAAEGLDFSTYFGYQALATVKILLLKASTDWPFSPDKSGKPIIDVDKFPDDAPILEVYEGYLDALSTFRESVSGTGESAEQQTVDGQPDIKS